MPIKKCKVGNRSGFKAGKRGKCYPGKQGYNKALNQMKAIKASEGRQTQKKKRRKK